jgi:hypothetical protein
MVLLSEMDSHSMTLLRPGLKFIKLVMETNLKAQGSDRLIRCLRFETGFQSQFYHL